MELCDEVVNVSSDRTDSSADLGGSSKSSMRTLKTEVEKGSM